MKKERGFFGVAMYFPKTNTNVGSLMRTAQILGCDFYAVIGTRYKHQNSDTMHATRHIPLFHYADFEDFYAHMPHDCQLVGVELHKDSALLDKFPHPQRAVYLLGAEDYGIPPKILGRCHHKVMMRGERSMNVAVAGSIVVYDRVRKVAAQCT